MHQRRNVALLALLYRDAYANRWESIEDVATDQEIAPGELGWRSMIVALLPEADWQIIASLQEPDDFERVARRLDPLRAEAMLHAQPPSGAYPSGKWAAPYRKRWGEIRSRMRLFEQQGYTATGDDLHIVASNSYQRATGGSHEGYLDAMEDAE